MPRCAGGGRSCSAARWTTSRWSCWPRPARVSRPRADKCCVPYSARRRGAAPVPWRCRSHPGGRRSAVGRYAPEPFLTVLLQLVADHQPRAVLVAGTSIGWDLAPLLACRLQAPLVTGCTALAIDGDLLVATVAFCGGKMMAEVQVDAAPAVLMVLPGSYRRPTATGRRLWSSARPLRRWRPVPSRFEEWILPEAGDVDITAAGRAGGRGTRDPDRRTTSNWPRNWPPRWAVRSAPRGRSSTRAGCRRRGRWASRA